MIIAGRQVGQDIFRARQREHLPIVGKPHDLRARADPLRIGVGVVRVRHVDEIVAAPFEQSRIERHAQQPTRPIVLKNLAHRDRGRPRTVGRPHSRDATAGPFRDPQIIVRTPDNLEGIRQTGRQHAFGEESARGVPSLQRADGG